MASLLERCVFYPQDRLLANLAGLTGSQGPSRSLRAPFIRQPSGSACSARMLSPLPPATPNTPHITLHQITRRCAWSASWNSARLPTSQELWHLRVRLAEAPVTQVIATSPPSFCISNAIVLRPTGLPLPFDASQVASI